MLQTERQAAIDDLLKGCRKPGHEITSARSLSPILLGRAWSHSNDDIALIEAMHELLSEQLALARRNIGLTLPVRHDQIDHQADLRIDTKPPEKDARASRDDKDVSSRSSLTVWSVLWAFYRCELSAEQIGGICGWDKRMSYYHLKEGREHYVAKQIALRELSSRSSPLDPPRPAAAASPIDPPRPATTAAPPIHLPRPATTDLMSFLRSHLIDDKGLHDLTENEEFLSFGLIGYRNTALAFEFVAMVQADEFNERRIVNLRKQYFEIVKTLPGEFGLKLRGRNPNGLLGFVYASPPSEQQIAFIKDQSQAWHLGDGGIVVSWTIDMAQRRIHTHNQIVSVFPPLFVAARFVFPGIDYLQSLIERYPD